MPDEDYQEIVQYKLGLSFQFSIPFDRYVRPHDNHGS
jgi:hypothetical protein